ncbi:RAMP superfamily CRISPR-associated protein [Thermococcus sp.]
MSKINDSHKNETPCYDFYSNIWTEIKELWEEIWNDRKVRLNRKQKSFEKIFFDSIWNSKIQKYPITEQPKILKLLESKFEELNKFSKNNFKKQIAKRPYYPKIPTPKDIYKNKMLPEVPLHEELKRHGVSTEILKLFKIINEFDDPKTLPAHSIYIQIKFMLKRPYLSRDDEDFYIIDNPIVKDKVFKLPMIRSTTWKGALRFAALKVFEEELNREKWKETREKIFRLFGNEKDNFENYLNYLISNKIKNTQEDVDNEWKTHLRERGYITEKIESFRGRLIFYPTFFDKMSLEVITPLRRDTKTPAMGPIYFEIVPESAIGVFRLLYYPFDLIAKGEFDRIKREAEEDMEFLAKSLRKMFYEIGFSAKKTSGFGTVEKIQKENIKIVPKDGEVDVKTILLREL